MELLDVYNLFKISPVKGHGSWIWDKENKRYLDCYGGHAVISIGHSHPHYIKRLKEQLETLAFYSNSVVNPLQQELADTLGILSGCDTYRLFLCNSGAEANENALKMASFSNGRSAVLALKNGFHGRTSAAVAATDNPAIQAPINTQQEVTFIEMNDEAKLLEELQTRKYCAFIVECVQGVGGLDSPSTSFLKAAEKACGESDTFLIADEVQSGFMRTGAFFAFQHHGITPDLVSMAKGMGNGFPVAGLLVHPDLKVRKGMLGTTFGGNHLACAAALAVLEVIRSENLQPHIIRMENYFKHGLADLEGVCRWKGKGLMLGLEFDQPVASLRKTLLEEHGIFTGGSANPCLLRILPPLNINQEEADFFINGLKTALTTLSNP